MTNLFKKRNMQKGYALLFAVIVSVIVLSVATFIVSVARKQFLLSAASRDSLYALYASDSGLECAINNINAFSASSSPPGSKIVCGLVSGGGQGIWNAAYQSTSAYAGTTTFSMYAGANDAGSSVGSCAYVMVEMWRDQTGNLITSIKSRGYNIGWNPDPAKLDCSTPGPRKVERAIQVLYQ